MVDVLDMAKERIEEDGKKVARIVVDECYHEAKTYHLDVTFTDKTRVMVGCFILKDNNGRDYVCILKNNMR